MTLTVALVAVTLLLWAFLFGLLTGMWLVRRAHRRASEHQYRVVKDFVEHPVSNGHSPQRR